MMCGLLFEFKNVSVIFFWTYMTNSRNHNDSHWCFFCPPSGSNSQLPTKPTKRSFLLSSHESTSAMAMLMPFLLKFVGIFLRKSSSQMFAGFSFRKWLFDF